MERTRSDKRISPIGDGNAESPPTRHEFNKLAALIDELGRQVARARKDIDVQFQRLADLQAVIDRMQIAAKKTRRDSSID